MKILKTTLLNKHCANVQGPADADDFAGVTNRLGNWVDM